MANKDVIADLVAQISLDGTKFTTGMGQVNRQLKTVQEELKTARSRFKQTGDSTDFLGTRSTALSNKLKLQKSSLNLLNKAYDESKESSGELSKNTQNLARRLEKAKREIIETETELKDVNKQLNPNKWKEVGKQAESAGKKMMTAGNNMRQFGQSYTMGVTAPILAGAGSALKAAVDFESAWTGVTKTVEGSSEQMASLEQSIRDMAKEIPASTSEIAAVAEAAGQLGIKTESIEGFTKTMINLGEATNLSAQQGATEMARFANVVGMSQDDFDKLGSTIVDLGNNLATTESEISEMALRLAGAGKQIGLTESDILAFSGALSSVGIKAEAGGSAFSRIMVDMANSVATTDDKLQTFAKVAGVSAKDFSKSFEQDASGALLSFISGLGKMTNEGENTFATLENLGFSEIRVRDALLRASNASDVFSGALDIGSKAWEENIALTEEAEKRYGTTESQLKIFWNRVKDTGITLGEELAPAMLEAIDAAEPFIEKIEDGAKAFAEMGEEQQRSILKMVGFAAAIGPASIVLGGLTTTIGGALRGFGALSSLLGRAGGAGLIARFASLGVTGPVGLAIAGVTGLTAVVYGVNKAFNANNEVSLKKIETMQKDIEQTDELIESFNRLKNKNELSNAQMLRYLDISAELEETTAPDKVKELKDEQADLLEQSGFTNKEMETFLGLNDKVIEKAPGTAKAISSEGEAYAENTQALKELNEEKRESLEREARNELIKSLEKEQELIKEKKGLITDINNLDVEQEKQVQKIISARKEVKNQEQKIKDLKLEIKNADEDAIPNLEMQLKLAKDELGYSEARVDMEKRTLDELGNQTEEKEKSLEKTRKELSKLDQVKLKYEELILAEAGITAEKGRGLETVNKEISKLQQEKRDLDDLLSKKKIGTAEYQEQNKKIDEQLGKLGITQSELRKINSIAEGTVYKDVKINPDPSIGSLDWALSREVSKRVRLSVTNPNGVLSIPQMADGGVHGGGKFIAGEEGFELGKMGNKWDVLNFGMYDKPAGYQVFTHDESKKILGALNRMPAYADGVSRSGEVDRVLNGLNGLSVSAPVTVNLNYQGNASMQDISEMVNIIEEELGNRLNSRFMVNGVRT
ncbi:phage tail tape measure protein [Terrihalobacillus insolitus]|uniref:phage tail tape measure protein n=1 Tax=Terrihalobacillus insolitus TaxID=2950438 RepID=UPI00234008FF|nr:phage tail tape measure protein [Terrihalobacillus insolitus]MDC3412522.1 phage tail tape measure protein [Terrihalobacillus insolitus]